MKIKFLGTNGWYPSGTGNCVCAAVLAKERMLVLDAGDGFWKAAQEAKKAGVQKIDVFLSHLHIDHVVGLHALPLFEEGNEVRIFVWEEDRENLRKLLNHPYTADYEKMKAKVEVVGLKVGENMLPYLVRCLPLVHADPCLGFRIEIEGKRIAYCTDTGECESMLQLAKGADLLVSECALLAGEESPKSWPHLSPQMAANAAKNANAKMLALTHFDAKRYCTLKKREEAQEAARRIFKNTIAAKDGKEVEF